MPFLHPEVVRLVVGRASAADVVIPKVGEQYETMHACYAKACLPHMEALLAVGRFKIAGFFAHVRVLEVAAEEVARYRDPDVCFMNVNTPRDLAGSREILARLEE